MHSPSSVERNGSWTGSRAGFTLIELLVGMAAFTLLLGVMISMIVQTGSVELRASNKIGSFQAARFAFELMTRTISQATLNAYYDYVDVSGHFVAPAYTNPPVGFARRSALDFVIATAQAPTIGGTASTAFGQGNSIFFQAKLGQSTTYPGMESLLNDVGYYVTYCKNPNLPTFLQPYDKYRFRLMQYLEPSENFSTYTADSNGSTLWFTGDLGADSCTIADNVILVLFWPRVSQQEEQAVGYVPLTTDYTYNSGLNAQTTPQPATANQEPPLVQVTLVAIDETTASRLCLSSTPPAAVTSCLTGLFQSPNNYTQDLATLESKLSAEHIGYQVFNSTVSLLESKWVK